MFYKRFPKGLIIEIPDGSGGITDGMRREESALQLGRSGENPGEQQQEDHKGTET